MKATISQSNLSKLLSSVSQYGSKAAVGLEITVYALLKAEENILSISGTNLETETTQSISAKIEIEGQTLVPIKKLNDLVSKLPGVDIKLSITKNDRLRLAWGNTASMSVRDVEDFPTIISFSESTDYITVDTEVLKTALPQIILAADESESRPILTGVNWNDNLKSSDGFMLA